ncbi:cation:proton antiporter [bacterium]|nr:cation:proton antiporter [bacterium]
MNLSLLLSLVFLLTFIFGKIIEKIRIPWIFAALFLGLIISINNPFSTITSSENFKFLSELGMYFLLFIIGLELQIGKMLKQGKFISELTFLLVFTETFFGALIVHYIFGVNWGISFLVASSFATVGEAVLVPILDEFKLADTKFGQTILGVATLDDIVEVLTVIVASAILGYSGGYTGESFINNLLLLGLLFFIPFLLLLFRKELNHFKFKGIPVLFLFSLFMFFLLIGIGEFVESGALGALIAGISLKEILNKKQISYIKSTVEIISYGFFVPIFFVNVGLETNVNFIISAPLLVLLVVAMTKSTKIITSYLVAKNIVGKRKSILLGIGLSVKFSTSIVILTMLIENNIISSALYSTLIGAMILSKFIIPVLFSQLIQKWDLTFEKA